MPDTLTPQELRKAHLYPRHIELGLGCDVCALLAHIDTLTEACLKCGQPVTGWFRHGQDTGHWPNGDPVVAFAEEPHDA